MLPINETDFKNEGIKLLKELKEKTSKLTQIENFTTDIIKIINESEDAHKDGNIKLSLEKYYRALETIEKAETNLRSEPLAQKLLWLEFGYLVFLLVLGYATYKWPDCNLWKGLINLDFQTVWFGALGGVTISIYGIYNHIQTGDFNPKFKLWYICKPIMGGIFGWFVYLIYFIGFISIQGVTIESIKAPQVPFVIAFLAGFSERFTIKMIDKLMAVLTTFEEQSAGGTTKPTKPK